MFQSSSRLRRAIQSARPILKATGLALAGLGVAGSAVTFAYCYTPVAADVDWRKQQKKIVIVGGGTAGLGIAAMLKNEGLKDVTMIEPKKVHYYQPLWTLVGAGLKSNEKSVRELKDLVPRGVSWVNKAVETFEPENNSVTLTDKSVVKYDYLVVAAGLQIDWEKIPGLVDALEKPDSGVVSIYDFRYSDKTWKTFQGLEKELKTDKETRERMMFTMPVGPIKCAGAPQKIMWLLEDHLKTSGLRDRVSVEFWIPGAAMFGVKRYSDMLEALRVKRGVKAEFKRELVSVDGNKKLAKFKCLDSGDFTEQSFDLIHVTPPMSAPNFIKASPFADKQGWVDVDKHTLQSTQYSNVFGIGDCTNAPTSKTAAAITGQAPVLLRNLQKQMESKPLDGYYEGYASCPLIIAKNRVILAEFGYGGKIMETFNPETGKLPLSLLGQEGELQQRFFFWLKEQFFPFAYWTMWVSGHWYGTNGPFKPDVTRKVELKSVDDVSQKAGA